MAPDWGAPYGTDWGALLIGAILLFGLWALGRIILKEE